MTPARLARVALLVLAVHPLRAQRPDADVLARMRAYLTSYLETQPTLVAEERYEQNRSVARRPFERRVLESELLMLRLPHDSGWISFRDVLEVDGRRVQDRERRLAELLQSPETKTLAQARRIALEAARYNLGSFTRTINLPDAGLTYLQEESAGRVVFSPPSGRARIDGIETVIVRFRETGRPTVVTTPNGRSVPAEGRVWIDPESGAIARTEVRFANPEAIVTVDFSMDTRMGVRVPVKMTEQYTSRAEYVTATAHYRNYRRFTVSTTLTLEKPPGG